MLTMIDNAVEEGLILLYSWGKSPYDGDLFHGSPLLLALFKRKPERWMLTLMFVLVDLAIAWILADTTRALVMRRVKEDAEEDRMLIDLKVDADGRNQLNKIDYRNGLSRKVGALCDSQLPSTVATLYLLNPYTILACSALNVNCIAHLFISSCLWASVNDWSVLSGLLLSFAIHLQGYPLVLAPALFFQVSHRNAFLASVVLSTLGLLYVAKGIVPMHSAEEILWLSFGRMCLVPDLYPNIGVWWYFFSEGFEQFHRYFLFVFNIHPFVYVIPLLIHMRHRPMELCCLLLCIFGLFKPYPDLGGISFAMSMFAMHPRSVQRMRFLFVLCVGMLIPSCLLPLMWHMWLYSGSGNANYYYFQNLILAMFICGTISEFALATVSRDINLKAYRKHMGNVKKKL